MLRSLVSSGVSVTRDVATITRSAGSRWNVFGSEAISAAIAAVIGSSRTVRESRHPLQGLDVGLLDGWRKSVTGPPRLIAKAQPRAVSDVASRYQTRYDLATLGDRDRFASGADLIEQREALGLELARRQLHMTSLIDQSHCVDRQRAAAAGRAKASAASLRV